jgi:uncharacterized protein (DUF885 family)
MPPRSFSLALGGLLLGASAQSPTVDPAAQLKTVADGYLAARLAAFPEIATQFGIPNSRHDGVRDVSAAGEQAWYKQEDHWLAELRRIDANALRGRPEWVTYGLLKEELEASKGVRVCRNRLWTVHPLTGWQATYAALAQQQPVGTSELRSQTLARWRKLPRLVNAEIANLREGLKLGYSEPGVNVKRVIAGMDKLLATSPTESPFYNPATRDSTPDFDAALGKLVADSLVPAMRRYRAFLADEYLPKARESISVEANPNGAACYRAAIRRFTTLDLTGEEIYQTGLRELAAAESSAAALSQRAFGNADYKAVKRRLQTDSTRTFTSRDRVIPVIDSVLNRAWAAVPKWFGIVPHSKLAVEPFPAFQEPSVPMGQYLRAALDGSRPGIYRVNLYLATKPGARLEIDRLTFHEGVPGHHFQLAIAQEREGVHPVTRLLSNSAFTEGWGIYSERLADEMGLYTSDAERLTDLEGMIYAFSTLVMETGMHTKGWTREQAIEYELEHTTRSREQAELDVDRRIGWPGQGLSYTIGYLEIERLRALVRKEQGEHFDIRAFHDRVLEDGSVTLGMLREKLERWARTGPPT